MLRNLLRSLFTYERIQTTLPRAKEARRFADRAIRFALKNTIAARREVAKVIPDRDLVKKLFDVVGPRFVGRDGGYTRIYRLGPREGDAAEMALLELVVREARHKEKEAEKQRGRKPRKPAPKKPARKATRESES